MTKSSLFNSCSQQEAQPVSIAGAGEMMWGSKFNKWKNSGEIFGVTVYLLYICTLDMKEFFKVLRRFVPPYKKYLVLTVLFNILSA
ncbi:MAG: hypothetical protein VZR04_03280, partial [Succiniclasticum sp.]|nr:hypothetical protein [Succiniclasticum sp.]